MEISLSVRHAARLGLQMLHAGFRGSTSTGWERGQQLSRQRFIGPEDVREIRAWFARHRYTSYPGYVKWVRDGKPLVATADNRDSYRGAVSWLLWGGDAMFSLVK